MAEITAAMVKELREQTGAGMMDCKKALNETNGNMEEAVEVLRKNGQAKAVKKEGRIAAEGICRIASKGDTVAAVVEVNSETDFVAKNEQFQQFVEAVAKQAVDSSAADMDAFLSEAWIEDGSKTVQEALIEKIAVIGDDLNDLPLFQRVGFSACPKDAHSYIQKIASIVLHRDGGHGAGRELCDLLMMAHGLLNTDGGPK